MPTVSNQELNILQRQKHALLRQFDRKEITEEECNTKIKPISETINIKIREMLNENSAKIKKEKEIEIKPEVQSKMAEEQPVQIETKKETKKTGPQSYTQLILKALMMKSVRTIEAAVDKVLEWRPGRDAKNVKTQMKTIIYLVKKQSPNSAKRWTKYVWNQDEFLLTEKTE